MNDHWDKLQKEKIDVKKIIQEDDRFISKIEKKINNIKAAINDPDVYNTNLASRDRIEKVEKSIEDLALNTHPPVEFTKKLNQLHDKIDSIYTLLETLSDRLNHMEYTGEIRYGDTYDVSRANKVVSVNLKRKDEINSPNPYGDDDFAKPK